MVSVPMIAWHAVDLALLTDGIDLNVAFAKKMLQYHGDNGLQCRHQLAIMGLCIHDAALIRICTAG